MGDVLLHILKTLGLNLSQKSKYVEKTFSH